MPYRVSLINGDVSKTIHSPYNQSLRLLSGEIHQSDSSIDSFSFSFNQTNPAGAFIQELKTLVEVLDVENDIVEFEGRIRNRTGSTLINGETVKNYSAEDVIAFLDDVCMDKFEYNGSPKGLFEKVMEYYNNNVEPFKQFDIGVCEADTYRVYMDTPTSGGGSVNQNLTVGAKATIKPTATYIWDNSGNRLNMANTVKGVTHTVAQIGTGTFAGKYQLRHPVSAWGISGWVQESDIVETYKVQTSQPVAQISQGVIIPGTAVRVKQTTTTYYHADGTAVGIPQFVKDRTHTIGGLQKSTGRYLIKYGNVNIAYVNPSDLEGGAVTNISQAPVNTQYFIEKSRTIEASVGYNDTPLDIIRENILQAFDCELVWEKIEGVRTLHIRDKISNETDSKIVIGLNMISMQENYDPTDIVTRLKPIGRKVRESG